MSDLKNVIKGGWHPKGKDGGKESWRGDFKGINQVAGWVGKGKKPGQGGAGGGGSDHVSRPLSTLKDPSSFGPPPKNVNYHGGIALPNEITPHTQGLGAPLSQDEIEGANQAVNGPTDEELEEQRKPAGPPLPYRADRTGLQTSHLPPPPVHRAIASPASPVTTTSPPKPKPGLPPRLPSRQNTADLQPTTSSPPPAYEAQNTAQPPPSRPTGGLNQSAMNRLGKAGISVPSLGIGTSAATAGTEPNPWKNERSQPTSPTVQPSQPSLNNMSEFQSRFARMTANSAAPATSSSPITMTDNTQSPSPTTTGNPPSQGTTWAQKQAALRTASNLHQNPSAVTLSDAQSAASTANNFRERHNDTIAAAGVKANTLNKRYNVTGRLNSFLEKQTPPGGEATTTTAVQQYPTTASAAASADTAGQPSRELAASISRKPPPPPPPKKPAGMHGNSTTAPPPPVPLGTKPNYS